MADVNANIGVNIDTSDALAQLKNLQRQLSQFHTSVAKSSSVAAAAQKSLQKNLVNSINSIGAFSAELRTVKTTTESFTNSLEKNKFSMREYFRYAGASTKTFGRLFTSELDTISKVAEDRVKKLQTQYIKLGRDSQGAMKAIAIMPNQLDFSKTSTQLQIAAQKQAIFNQLLKQGSTNLLNFGKNTQWAGRQLMVGFTIPLGILGMRASQTFMDMEKAALKFKKVYGDLLTSPEETKAALDGIKELGKQYTRYGVAVADTVALSAEAAAAGFQGVDLQRQTAQATRLSVLGQIEAQQALETTIALQNSFRMSSEDLAGSIDFLNAVENQTVTSLDDITTAIPKVAPVIQQLGGDVKDLAFFITAMKEGGINASEGANALKSGLAALINPTTKASAMLADMGININGIVESNKGDLKATVIGFAQALDTLDPLTRARAIEQMFGKFQFARLSTLFQNVTKDGTQAGRVLKLAGTSIADLAAQSEKELGMTAASPMNQFKKAVEDLKLALVPVGETFLKSVTPIVEFFGNMLEKFSSLSDNTKKIITIITIAVAGVGPVLLMTFGLLANGVANIIKLFATLRNGYLKLTGQSTVLGEQTQYMTMEQLEASAAAHSLNQSHATLKQTFDVEKASLDQLIASYQSAARASRAFAAANPGAMLPIPGGKGPKKLAIGGIIKGPGTGTSDSIPAMLSNGEAVIPAKIVKKYPAMVSGLIAGNIPGYKLGTTGAGSFGISIGKAKEDVDLYKAPSTIKPQTTANTWSTMQAEIDAITIAGEEYLRELGFNAEQIAKKLGNLTQKQASHITEQIYQIDLAGETIDIKEWNASNLITDFGGINNYLNSIHKVVETLDEEEISRLASTVNMSIDEFKSELQKLSDNIHPTTRKAGQVLGAIAKKGSSSTDKTLAYQSKAIAAGMDVRLGGDFYETVSDRAYDTDKDVKSLEKVEANVLKLKKKVLDAFNISDDIAILSGKNIQSLQNAWSQLSLEAKERLIALSGDANAFTTALMQEAKQAGIAGFEVGNEAVKGVAKGAQTASDSKATIKTGVDVGNGLKTGMDSTLDDVAASGQRLGKTATDSVRAGTRPQGPAPLLPPPGATMLPIVSQPTRSDLIRTGIRDKFRSAKGMVAKNFSGGRGMAMSSAAMLGSQFLPGKAGQIAGQASSVAFAVQGLAMLPGPAKLVAGGFLALYGINKLLNAATEKARLKLEGLGDTANLSGDKIKSLGDYFGVSPTKSPFEKGGTTSPLAPAAASAVDQLRGSDFFKKDFKKEIESLKNATDSEAGGVMAALGTKLSGSGFAKEQIDTILAALQQEAGKTSLDFKFASVDITTKEGKAGFDKALDTSLTALENSLTKGSEKIIYLVSQKNEKGQIEQIRKTKTVLDEAAKKDLFTASQSITATITGLSGQLANGAINGEQFSKAFDSISNSISKMPKAQGLMLVDNLMRSLPENLRATARGLNDVKSQMMLLQAQALGLTNVAGLAEAMATLTNPFADAKSKVDAKRTLEQAKKDIKDRTKLMESLAAAQNGTGKGKSSGKKEEPKFNFLEYSQKAFQAAKNQAVAFEKLRDAGFDAAFAMELVGNADLAAAVAAGGLTDEIKRQLLLMKGRQDELKEYQKLIEDASKTEADRERERLAQLEARFNLEEEIVKAKYSDRLEKENENLRNQEYELELINRKLRDQADAVAALIDPKQQRIDDISYQLEGISFKENEINEKYDRQSKLLSTIAKMNQDLFSIQKKRASLADALSSGDISAAASLIMEMRAEQAGIQATSQQEVLDAAREQELSALGRVALEKESKKLQYEILTIQRNQSKEQENLAKIIEKNIESVKDSITDMEESLADEIASVNNRISKSVGMTKTQIQSAMSMIDLANAAGFNMNNKTLITNILQAAVDKANDLKKILGELPGVTIPETVPPQSDQPRTPILGETKYIGSVLMTYDGSKWVETSKYKTPVVEQPANLPNTEYNPGTYVPSTGYVPPEVERPANLPDTEYNPGTYVPSTGYVPPTTSTPTITVPRGAAPLDDEPVATTPGVPAIDIGDISITDPFPELGNSGGFILPGLDAFGGNFLADLGAQLSAMGYLSRGGMVPKYFANGGFNRGTDTVPAMLTPGEFVVNKRAVSGLGISNLNKINNGEMPGGSVYNYKVDVTLNGSDMNPNDVANAVLTKIKQLESRNVRRQGI